MLLYGTGRFGDRIAHLVIGFAAVACRQPGASRPLDATPVDAVPIDALVDTADAADAAGPPAPVATKHVRRAHAVNRKLDAASWCCRHAEANSAVGHVNGPSTPTMRTPWPAAHAA